MSKYRYQGPPEQRIFGPLPDGDYQFQIASADEPYEKNDKLIMSVKLTILPDNVPVFYNPWTGVDSSGKARDGIADLLIAVNRAPKIGEEPDWKRLVGAKGRCRLTTEIAGQGNLAGKEVNKVHYLYRPKEIGPVTHSKAELERTQQEVTGKARQRDPDLDVEPDDIPFRSTIYRDVKRSKLSRRFVQ